MNTAIAEAIAIHKQGRLEEASQHYQQILDAEPDNADVLNYLGMLEFQRDNTEKGIELAEKCVSVYADHAAGCNNLANMYLSTYRVDEAERYYLNAIAIDDRAPEPIYNMAVIEKSRKRYTEAENYFNRVLEINPQHVVCMSSLADMYSRLGHFAPALQLLEACLGIGMDEQSQKSTLESMARLCQLLDKKKAAIDIYERWLEAYPEDATAAHMLSAATGQNVLDKPDEQHIKDTFDRFAGSFDKVLNNLEYKAPQYIQTTVERLFQHTQPNSLVIVDAGCGTGLCGHFLAPLASTLTGVDLSPEMLKRAKYRDQYDALLEQDINRYLKGVSASIDLLVSADTLCYFGELREFLSLLHAALSSGGVIVFTVERCEHEAPAGYKLESHGRYSHTLDYLMQSLQAAGYHVDGIEERDLRMERNKPVGGYLVSVRKPG